MVEIRVFYGHCGAWDADVVEKRVMFRNYGAPEYLGAIFMQRIVIFDHLKIGHAKLKMNLQIFNHVMTRCAILIKI